MSDHWLASTTIVCLPGITRMMVRQIKDECMSYTIAEALIAHSGAFLITDARLPSSRHNAHDHHHYDKGNVIR